jgi:adenosylcobinamide-GDP ribazoletransferase
VDFIRHYLLAVQFFTRIPVTGRVAAWVGYSPAMLRASAAHFPGVGWLVALVACTVAALSGTLLHGRPGSALVTAVLCTIATVLVTGGFHEDGLADVADGLGGSAARERALEIMKDSRVGAFGAMALVLALRAAARPCWQRWWVATCGRAFARCCWCAGCRTWATPPPPKASRWPTRSAGALSA